MVATLHFFRENARDSNFNIRYRPRQVVRGQDSRPRVILHIGLHKTGTRYLQREVFGQLDPTLYNVNPESVWLPLRQAVRRCNDTLAREAAREAVRQWRYSGDGRSLIISEPHISGDMYGNHHDFAENAALMRELFPEARILYFVRDQADWLQSAYRQQLVKGGSVPPHVFLNHYDGAFVPRPDRWVYGARTVEALNQRFLAIYNIYRDLFGEERVDLVRQEDLRGHPEVVKARIANILGLTALPEVRREKTQNRSYSALAIQIFHPGTRQYRPTPTADDLGHRPSRHRKALRPLKRLRRLFIQHVFDKLIYRDWDLLGADAMRERIKAHYAEENREIARIAGITLARTRPARFSTGQAPALTIDTQAI